MRLPPFSLRLLVLLFLLCLGRVEAEQASQPAILFCSWTQNGYIDLDYLQRLKAKGFTVDFTKDWSEVTWERVQQYHALVIFNFPQKGTVTRMPGEGPARGMPFEEFTAMLDRYREMGGGVFVIAESLGPLVSTGYDSTLYKVTNEGLAPFGAAIPMETLSVPEAELRKHPRIPILRFGYFSHVLPSPVSEGVRGIWLPIAKLDGHNRMVAGALQVDANWQPVVRGGPSFRSEPIDMEALRVGSKTPMPPEDIVQRKEGVDDPVVFAIREYQGARLALFHCFPVFHIGSGTKWFYDGVVLDKGMAGKPSDFGRLLENTLRWLAEPAMKLGKLGGAEVPAERLLPPQLQPGARAKFDPKLQNLDPDFRAPARKVFLGFTGVRTKYSGGKDDVATYAKAAKEAGLNFVIFLEDLNQLSPEEFAQLKKECQEQSTEDLLLIPGYFMSTNIGNRIFIYGQGMDLPPAGMMSKNDKSLFALQSEDEKGNFKVGSTALGFLLGLPGHGKKLGNVGFFDFQRSAEKGGISLEHGRAFGAAGVRFYEDGRLIEDVTDLFLRTNSGTMSPLPLAVDLTTSAEGMKRSVSEGRAVTSAVASSQDKLMKEALGWNHQFESPQVAVAEGGTITSWPQTNRVWIYGGERFVNSMNLLPATLEVNSPAGIREIALYDGERLFRRFEPKGQPKEFFVRLFLDGELQRNVTAIVTDTRGRKSVSFPLRTWKEASSAPLFCGDHVNDCRSINMKFGRGPLWPRTYFDAIVPDAGITWDGGPTPVRDIYPFKENSLLLKLKDAESQKSPPYQYPSLVFCDEEVFRGASIINGELKSDGNPWTGWGPIAAPSVFTGQATMTEWGRYSNGVDPTNYGPPWLAGGPIASLFEQDLNFVKGGVVTEFLQSRRWLEPDEELRGMLLTGQGDKLESATTLKSVDERNAKEITIPTGGWFAVASADDANGFITFNRGEPIKLRFAGRERYVYAALPAEGLAIAPGDRHRLELLTIQWPLDQPIRDSDAVMAAIRYLEQPAGLQVIRGKRIASQGLLEFDAADFAAEILIPAPPKEVPDMLLPTRVSGLNPRWSAGLLQIEGENGKKYYSDGKLGYRALGVDERGRVYTPLHVSQSPQTHVRLGHPIVADGMQASDLFIQTTALREKRGDKPPLWHISVNNPTDKPLNVTLRQAMELPGLSFPKTEMRLEPGEYRVLRHNMPDDAATASR